MRRSRKKKGDLLAVSVTIMVRSKRQDLVTLIFNNQVLVVRGSLCDTTDDVGAATHIYLGEVSLK